MTTVFSSKFPFVASKDPTVMAWVGHLEGRAKHARAGLAAVYEVQS